MDSMKVYPIANNEFESSTVAFLAYINWSKNVLIQTMD